MQPTFNDSGSTTTDGLQLTDQGPPATWAPTTAFTAGQLIVDNSSPNPHVQQVVGPGMTGTTEGPFNTSGGYTTDGSVVWLDRGLATYQPTHAYNVGDAFSDGTDIQQALTAGTSGGSAPSFTHTPGAVTPDNAAVWTDEGVLAWAGNTAYDDSTAAKTFVVDGTNHVQKAAIAGTSSTSGPPAFVDGGLTLNDGAVTWQDQGVPLWHPAAYALNIVVIDAAGHLQQVTTAGTSGPVQPTFNDSGSTTTDGLQWTDQGSPANWAGTTAFTAGQLVVDNSSPNPHVQQVVGAGTTGSSEGPFNTSGGYTTDGSVVWLDRGLAGYQSAHAYNVGDAFSDGTDIQQAVTAGTSGGSAPSFTDTPGITPDNVVIWTDEGTSPWQNNHIYAANSFIIDSAGHVQETTAGGKSGNNPPTFNDDNLAAEGVYDGLLWQDIGPLLTWSANTPFTASAVAPFTLVVGNNFLQEATTTGASGTSTPTWNSVVGKMTVDGLQWTDEGVMQRQPGQLYSNPTLVSDPAGHAQSLYEAGTAGSGATPAGGWKDDGTNTIDNAAIWTESDPTRQTSQPYVLGAIVLNTPGTAGAHVEQVSLAGTTGPGAMATAFSTSGGTVIDGLQWQNQTSPPVAVAARYPVTSATPTLTSLALDPLIADCTSGCSYTLTTLRTSNFWLGDSQSGKVYKLDFATGGGGTPPSFDLDAARSAACAGCSAITVQGLGIYGSEGANQPGLAKLLFNSNATPANTQVAYFPSSTAASKNSLTITLYNGSTAAATLVPFAVYASAIAPLSCYTDLPGSPSCALTFPTGPSNTPPNLPLVWKNDIPLPSSGNLSLSGTQTLAGNFEFPVGQSFSNDVALDAFYDTTTSVGTDSPTYVKPSTAMLYLVNSGNGGPEHDYGCTYSSPVISPSKSCYANPGTIPIKFACSKLPGMSVQSFGVSSTTPWGPTLEITQYGKPPVPTPGSPSTPAPFPTGSAPSESNGNNLSHTTLNLAPELAATQLPSSNGGITYNMKNSNWTYNWVVTSTSQGQVYKICTYDDSSGSWNASGKAKPFCTPFFYVKNSCP